MTQKHGAALSKTSASQDAGVYLSDLWLDRVQQCEVDSVLIDLIFDVF